MATNLRDTSNRDWTYVEDGVVVYRASALGGCIRSLVASRLGESPTAPGQTLQAVMDASSAAEEKAIAAYIRDTGHEVIWQQKEVELPIPGNGHTQEYIVRGHIDGLDKPDDVVLEVKSLGADLFGKWDNGGVAALGSLGTKYVWQGALYGHSVKRAVRFVAFSKAATGEEPDLIIDSTMDAEDLIPWQEIVDRITTVEEHVANDTYPECDRGCTAWDAYAHVHFFSGPTIHLDEAGDDLESLLSRHYDLKMRIDELTMQKDELSDAIKHEYGEGSHVAGPYTARIERTKGSARIDTKLLKKMRPDIAEEFTVIGMPTIRLTIKKTGD